MNTGSNTTEIALLQKENQRLRKAVEELSILNDIATAISSTQSLDKIVNLIVQKCVKHLNVEQGAVMLLDEQENGAHFHTMIRKADTTGNILPYRFNTQLTGWLLKNQKPLIVNNLKEDDRFRNIGEMELPIRSLLGVPLLLKGRMIGVLTVFNKKTEEGFSEDDQRLLSIISAQSAQIIENARLYQEEQKYIHLQEEMRFAAEIQRNLLPTSVPRVPGYQISGKTVPAKEVGGDYFDFIPMDEHRLAFCLGDVSGKGMPAAMLMANLQATLRGQTHPDTSCKDCISRSNTLLFHSTDPKKFATLFYGVLDYRLHRLSYCNAGHDNPFLFMPGQTPTRLETGGVVLGFVPEFPFNEETIPFPVNQLLLVYSDGVTEAMNDKEEEFSEERLAELVRRNINKTTVEIIAEIMSAIEKHVGNIPQMDDMTLLAIKRVE